MRHLLLVPLALTGLVLCPTDGWTQSRNYQFMGKSFDLPTPTGYCIPDAANANDAAFTKAKTALIANVGFKVIKIAASCKQLGQRDFPTELIIYYGHAAADPAAQESTQSQRKAVCDEMRGETDASLSNVPDKVAETAKELNQKLSVSNVKALGILAEDAHGCYSGLMVTTSNSTGPYIATVDLLGTVLHGTKIWTSLYGKYQDSAASQKSLLLLEAIAADMDARNRD